MLNCRFWVWVNDGFVKLSMRPGTTLEWSHRWQHDEGWSLEALSFEYDGERVRCQQVTDGRDCDGRLTRCTVTTCSAGHLLMRPVTLDGETHLMPQWELEEHQQRDYSAEAMGY